VLHDELMVGPSLRAQRRIDWESLQLMGRSSPFLHILGMLDVWSGVDATVLITGETGTGKELAARALHELSERRLARFVPINCAAIPENLMESELFGHVRGAFTDAKAAGRGLVAQAEGGTLFLDEVDALSARAQAALLRFAQDRHYRPVGSPDAALADVRLIAATNADLHALARARTFREDLLYRLNLLTLALPPLREREGDPLLLARMFVTKLCVQYQSGPRELDAESVQALGCARRWPGNVRELEHLVHRCFLLSRGRFVHLELEPTAKPARSNASCSLSFAEEKARVIADFEARYVRELLARANGNLSLAARLAGKERSRFGKLVRKHGLQREAFVLPPSCQATERVLPRDVRSSSSD
jgi:DNA-binding NtrC family response regulator